MEVAPQLIFMCCSWWPRQHSGKPQSLSAPKITTKIWYICSINYCMAEWGHVSPSMIACKRDCHFKTSIRRIQKMNGTTEEESWAEYVITVPTAFPLCNFPAEWRAYSFSLDPHGFEIAVALANTWRRPQSRHHITSEALWSARPEVGLIPSMRWSHLL